MIYVRNILLISGYTEFICYLSVKDDILSLKMCEIPVYSAMSDILIIP